MHYVIIGASAAGLSAAETVRLLDPQGAITLISEEAIRPYRRPMLTYLLGREAGLDDIWLRPPSHFYKLGVRALLGEGVVQVDPQAKEVHLAGGRVVRYDRLLVASGAQPRLLGIPGENLAGVFTLRHLADWQKLEANLRAGAAVAVVGAGPVGLKAAEALVRRGQRVILVEAEAGPLPRLLDQTAGFLLKQHLSGLGVELYFETRPVAILGDGGRVRALVLADGRELAVEVVLLAVGVRSRLEFFQGTSLASDGPISVSSFLQTQYPEIFAAGDCTAVPDFFSGKPTSYQIWPAAVSQGQVAGANMVGAGRRYAGLLPQNSISIQGFKIISGGLLAPDPQRTEVWSSFDDKRGVYRRLLFQEGCLVGVTLAGEVADAGIYFQIMAQKLPVKALPVDLRSPDFHPGKLWG